MAESGRGLRVIPGGRDPGASAPAVASASAASASTALLAELYGKYGSSVYARCHYLLRDRAKSEDAMQDVFAKALVNLAGFRAEASPLTWLTTIATNHCLNLLRADQAGWRREYEDEERARVAVVERSDAGAGARWYENRQFVRRLLADVDIETQAAAIHYFVDEMTLEEVAAAIGRSVPTVRKRLEAFAAKGGAEREAGRNEQ